MAASRCPHDCSHCRAIELGYAGRPLTPAEFLDVHGGVVERKKEPIPLTQETIEAGLAAELAAVQFDEAKRTYFRVREEVDRTWHDPSQRQKLHEAEQVARAELDDAEERLRAARVRHGELTRRDQGRHRRAEYEAGIEETKRQHAARKEAARKRGKGVIRKLVSVSPD